MHLVISVKFENKNKANDILKYGITLCQGKGCKCPENVRLALILSLKDELISLGAVWQAQRLNNHLHKAQKGFMTTQRDNGGV